MVIIMVVVIVLFMVVMVVVMVIIMMVVMVVIMVAIIDNVAIILVKYNHGGVGGVPQTLSDLNFK